MLPPAHREIAPATRSGAPAQPGPPLHVSRRRRARLKRLRSLGYRSYPDYLRAAHWQQVKARYRASDRPQQCMCGADEHLQIHHLTYERVGAELLTDLIALCPTCHQILHVLERRGDISLDGAGLTNAERALANKLAAAQTAAERTAEDNARLNGLLASIVLGSDAQRRTAIGHVDRRTWALIGSDVRVVRQQLERGKAISDPRVRRRLDAIQQKLRAA